MQQQQQTVVISKSEPCYTEDSRPAEVDGVDIQAQGVRNVPTGVANDVTPTTSTSVDFLNDKISARIGGYDSKKNEKQTPFDDPKDAKINILASTVASMQSTLMMLLEQQLKGTMTAPVPEQKKAKVLKRPCPPIDEEERSRVEVLRRTVDLVGDSDDENSRSDTSEIALEKQTGDVPKAKSESDSKKWSALKTRFKARPKRNGTLKNWQDGMKRNCTSEAMFQQIEEITVDSLPAALEMMKKVGVAVIRDYDSVMGCLSDSSDDFEPEPGNATTTPLRTSVFSECNAPSEEQAMYYERGVMDSKGNKGKPPAAEHIFEGAVISSGNWDVTAIRKPAVCVYK